MMQGRLIAIEGIDQSGKRTQAHLLSKTLRRKGFKVKILSFPIYSSSSGQQLKEFLTGRRHYPAQAVHMMYSLNRWENLEAINNALTIYDYVIADRYSPSNLAYGVSRGLEFEWLRDLDKGLPVPSLVIVLDVPVSRSFRRKRTGRDVHEKDRIFLERVRRSYKILAKKLGWRTVDGTGEPSAIQFQMSKLVETRFRQKSLNR
ncbi:MAG TPA: dTMP kinase [Candidatus Bathyarchaeia archaeon]|nr:dTMP kinase [Candidatus Bathyarchaeia archaeon]